MHNPHLDGRPFIMECPGDTAVLLFHGLTATPLEVRALGDFLHAQGYTVDGPLLPGHGTRLADLDRVRWQDWTAYAQERYDRLAERYQHVFVGGESAGAVVALWLATQNPGAAGVLAFAPAIRLSLPPSRLALLYLAMPFGLQVQKRGLEKDPTWQGYKAHTPRGVIELVRMQRAVRAGLSRIRQPVFIMQGRRDRTIQPRAAEIVRDGVSTRDVELHWLANSGHCVLLDQEFQTAARRTAAFIRRIRAQGGETVSGAQESGE